MLKPKVLSYATVTTVLASCLLISASAFGHAERPAYFPNYKLGKVPSFRSSGPELVVCKANSAKLIAKLPSKYRSDNSALLKKCKYRHIQAAVNDAKSGYRVEILPGIYREEPSRAKPDDPTECKKLLTKTAYAGSAGAAGPNAATSRNTAGKAVAAGTPVPNYEYHANCPNAKNLIAIMGDGNDKDRRCDQKCNLQIEGTARAEDVVLYGDKAKLNVIRGDRADGLALRNFTVQYSDFNDVYVIETNGFRFSNLVTRWSREYGILTFTSDNGLYEDIEAYGNGDSGVYPGSGPEGHCKRYGIEIRDVDSYGNTMGYSGTAGNGIYAHDNKFHGNALGMSTDSFAAGHPGMPQDCVKWEDNEIYSNNFDVFNDKRDAYCKKDYAKRNPKTVCPSFQVPEGLGIMIAGGNGNIVKGNTIYDNWRAGAWLFWVPAGARGEDDPAKQTDTSYDNQFLDNEMGVRPDGTRDPNGVDFIWDEEGSGNCWSGNVGPGGAQPTSDPSTLPTCPGSTVFSAGDNAKLVGLIPCTNWNAQTNTDPAGCDWFTLPPEPK